MYTPFCFASCMEAPGESRIPTVRRSGLPRPSSAVSRLQLSGVQYKPGDPAPIAQARTHIVDPAAHIYEGAPQHHTSPAHHIPAGQAVVPRLRLSSGKVVRYSDGDILEAHSRRASRPSSTGSRLSYPYSSGESWVDEDRVWGRERHRGLRASTESAFSRQLAKITRGSEEDVSDPSLTYRVSSVLGARTCWDGPLLHAAVEPHSKYPTQESVGRRVVVAGTEHGTLRYFGRTAFASGEWCGIELERPVGKNDGSVNGVIYFSCRPDYGIFAPASKVFLILDEIGGNDARSVNVANSGKGQIWQGLMPSSTQTQEPNAVRRRPSDASNATYTIEGRDSSVPNSPESQESLQTRDFTQTKGRSACHDEHEDDVASLGSPEDATCDESSLGILTPDQMPDFTVTASASLGRSPSDEDVAALEDEVCDASLPAEASGREVPLVRWDSEQSMSGVVDEELFKKDVSAIIRELRTSAEVSSSNSSSPTRPHPSPETEQFQHDEEEAEKQQKKEDEKEEEKKKVELQQIQEHKDQEEAIHEEDQSETIHELRGVPIGVDLSRLPAMARRVAPLTTRLLLASSTTGEAAPDVEAAWSGSAAAMTTSAGSLDQGYQGDAECDPRSEGGTGTASSPTEDVRLFQGVIDVERLTEGDVSLADDEAEADHGQVTARDRTARIIDGKLYHNHRELGRPHDPHASEMDSSGFYSDLDPRDREAEDESARTDLEPVQEALGNSSLHDSLLDDHLQDDNTHNDHTLDDHSLKDDLTYNKDASVAVDEEDRSSASTLRPESKDLTSIENTDRSYAPSPTEPKQTSPTPGENVQLTSLGGTKSELAVITAEAKLTDSGIYVEAAEDPTKEQQQAPKVRTYEKPWLSRPPPPKKKEEVRKHLPPPPPMPKKNVQSKLKAMLEAQEPVSEETRRQRQPRKNRWDAVMNKIAEGQKDERVRPRIEVKSRLLEGLKTQAQLSPQAEKIRQERRERRERRERQAAAAAVAARRVSQVRSDRKRSSASIRSNRTSRAPSLDSLPTDPTRTLSRGSTPDQSEASNKSSSTASGGGSRGSRESRVLTSARASTTTAEKKRQEAAPPPRRPRLDNIKSTIPKPGRLPPRKVTGEYMSR
ncbi:CAP-Gly domain-containing linker protein 1-like isoform X3 [Penaeus chinensis]|uniref:CAP-Gly domain-containing linker protein 1-like isoform X3 n=1 Tax=Penaeus chinensis TaxID=139456 RepID=UPI001FB72C03|nr:CAP-Gly domain-containing linker protein 1-like isoform X3 [Penaeus chinensis]